jgi:hypothetical protein
VQSNQKLIVQPKTAPPPPPQHIAPPLHGIGLADSLHNRRGDAYGIFKVWYNYRLSLLL